jgi:hypothetical protein
VARSPSSRDVLAGLVFAVIGLAGLWIGRDLPMGTAEEMGTGYVPRLMCWLLVALGTIIVLAALRAPAVRVGRIAWRPLVLVTAAVLVLAVALETLGAFVAVALTVALASFAGERGTLPSVAVAAVVLGLAVTTLFVWGLGLPVPAFPRIAG